MKLSIASLALGFALSGAAPALAQEFGVIPTRVIYPGETISADALKMGKIRKGRTSKVVIALKAEELVGKVAQRTLLANRFVPVSYVREAYVVEAGKPVFAELVQDFLTITISAVTLEPGSTGDVIRVRNTDSGKVFSGTVMDNGTVRVAAQ
jgi:flagella basal body P-ring formation protein FlgA